MKIRLILVILLISVFILTSCNKEGSNPTSTDLNSDIDASSGLNLNMTPNIIHYKDNKIEHDEFEELIELEPNDESDVIYEKFTEVYSISKSIEDPVYNFSDAIFVDDKIISTDKRRSQLVILDSNLVVEDTIGSLGSGNLEFQNPIALDKDKNNNIYILDSGNGRIQVLDVNFNYVKEIKLNFLDERSVYEKNIGFIVDNEGKFAYFTDTYQAMLLCIDLNNGVIHRLEDYTSGKFTKDEEYVYYVNRCHYILDGPNMNGYTKYIYLYKIKENIICEKVRLFDDLYTLGVTVIDDSLYFMNGSNLFMIEYDLNGNYISSPYSGMYDDKNQVPEEEKEDNDDIAENGKLYFTAYTMKQGKGKDLIVIYNSLDFREDLKGGSLAILSNK